MERKQGNLMGWLVFQGRVSRSSLKAHVPAMAGDTLLTGPEKLVHCNSSSWGVISAAMANRCQIDSALPHVRCISEEHFGSETYLRCLGPDDTSDKEVGRW